MTPQPAYPGGDFTVYGVTAALYHEGGGVVCGHGRRALAAANALGRYEGGGSGWYRPYAAHRPTVTESWATFVATCGCTPEEHADASHECGATCDYAGLPPCNCDYGWLCVTSAERRPGDLPVVEVKW